MDDVTAAKILVSCLDLTSLNESDNDETITALCQRASTPAGSVAAVCVYPKFVPLALQSLSGNVKIATVVNFPSGGADLAKLETEINKALKAGADEIDCVFPYRRFINGDVDNCRRYLEHARQLCGTEHALKIILETGELQTTTRIKTAAQFCIEAGADFIKTSTGKTKISATPEAANAILEVIRASKQEVGFKASGGIKTIDEAKKYLVLANSIMGPDWVNSRHFRIGASSLLTDLLATLKQGF